MILKEKIENFAYFRLYFIENGHRLYLNRVFAR